jgi:hypothetical protein
MFFAQWVLELRDVVGGVVVSVVDIGACFGGHG